jgi:hypothetical protein
MSSGMKEFMPVATAIPEGDGFTGSPVHGGRAEQGMQRV